jgi:uncharacterized protein (UPF0335 family)
MVEYQNSNTAGQELRSFAERMQRLDAEAKDITDAKKECMAELKGRGYDVKVFRKLLAEMKRDRDDVAEEEAIMEMYRVALGLDYSMVAVGVRDETPDTEDDVASLV